jgi:hypothetical protein
MVATTVLPPWVRLFTVDITSLAVWESRALVDSSRKSTLGW